MSQKVETQFSHDESFEGNKGISKQAEEELKKREKKEMIVKKERPKVREIVLKNSKYFETMKKKISEVVKDDIMKDLTQKAKDANKETTGKILKDERNKVLGGYYGVDFFNNNDISEELVVKRKPFSGEIIGFDEFKDILGDDRKCSLETMSLNRRNQKTLANDSVKGNSDSLLFEPSFYQEFHEERTIFEKYITSSKEKRDQQRLKEIEDTLSIFKDSENLEVLKESLPFDFKDLEKKEGEKKNEKGKEKETKKKKEEKKEEKDIKDIEKEENLEKDLFANMDDFLEFEKFEKEEKEKKKKEKEKENSLLKTKDVTEIQIEGETVSMITNETEEEKPKTEMTLPKLSSKIFEEEEIIRKEEEEKGIKYSVEERRNMKDFNKEIPTLAMTFKFELDEWQKEAIYRVENHQNVFVAAHTSSGKTVTAEYAIALSQKHQTKTIYTSPIKSLSNQKYREFQVKFGDGNVGIVTGDVQIHPNAPCLIMTTEILRSMVYRGSDILRDVEFVIFDEIHYINDPERGVVWEELIILLPKHISLVFLSATIPKIKEFAGWIGRTRVKTTYIVSTRKRVIPLQHSLHVIDKTFIIVSKDGQFIPQAYQQASRYCSELLQKNAKKNKGGNFGKGGSSSGKKSNTRCDWSNVVQNLFDSGKLPCVVFEFSRKGCERLAYEEIEKKIDLTTPSEKHEITQFLQSSIKMLSKKEQNLYQIIQLSEILVRGIGVHHSGLLPLLKEVVEILFSKNLVKVLFATETFAMGVNMPAKTVLFNGVRKHDGHGIRELHTSEYIQMAGRAGRRGIDTVGNVFINVYDINEILPDHLYKNLILGEPTEILSKFRVSTNMILNLMRVSPSFSFSQILRRSFSESNSKFLTISQIGRLQQAQKQLDIEELNFSGCPLSNPSMMREFHNSSEDLINMNRKLMDVSFNFLKIDKLVNRGSVVVIQTTHNNKNKQNYDKNIFKVCLGVILDDFDSIKNDEQITNSTKVDQKLTVFCLKSVFCSFTSSLIPFFNTLDEIELNRINQSQSDPGLEDVEGVFHIDKSDILVVTGVKLNLENNQNDLLKSSLIRLWKKGFEVKRDQRLVKNFDFVEISTKIDNFLLDSIKKEHSPLQECSNCSKRTSHLLSFISIEEKRRQNKRELESVSDSNLRLLPDFFSRLNLLKKLNFLTIDENSSKPGSIGGVTVELKGKVACEVNSCESILLTEMIFQNFFELKNECAVEGDENTNDINIIPALLSVLICKEDIDEENEEEANREKPIWNKKIDSYMDFLYGIVDKLEKDANEAEMNGGLNLASQIKTGIMESVYLWTLGHPFADIIKKSNVQPGEIVRNITQICQILRELKNCARVIGNVNLSETVDILTSKIKRDIVFTTSLYLY